jgi:hypothetical protein
VPTSTATLGLRCVRQEAFAATETSANATLHPRAMHEVKALVSISVYLYVTLGSVILMKVAVLHTEGIAFTPWGIAMVKAVVLGERTTTGPLIWPTLEKALVFLVLLMIMTPIEDAVVGLSHHQSTAVSLGELFGPRLQETIAGYLIKPLVFIPYSAFMVLAQTLGEGRLARMFFVERQPMKQW